MKTTLVSIVCCLALALVPGRAAAQRTVLPDEALPQEIERMYQRGCEWLVKQQREDGGWPDNYGQQPGVVGLAVVAMLAHGDDPNSGPYALTIRRAIDRLIKGQDKETGYLGNSMYNHGFGTLALAEAYGMVDDPRIGPALRDAVKLLLQSQSVNPYGAWRYRPQDTSADTTVAGACFVALMAARNAGIAVPESAVEKALAFYKSCQDQSGGVGYTNAGGPNQIRTSIASLAFALAKKKDTGEYKKANHYLFSQQGHMESGHRFYFLYYAAQAYFQGDMGRWHQWNARTVRMLAAQQAEDGSWSGNQQQTFSTATGLLALALNYRFLPIYER